MNNYQKAIKVRKTCENTKKCEECIYYDTCINTSIVFYIEDLKTIAKIIKDKKIKVN